MKVDKSNFLLFISVVSEVQCYLDQIPLKLVNNELNDFKVNCHAHSTGAKNAKFFQEITDFVLPSEDFTLDFLGWSGYKGILFIQLLSKRSLYRF